MKTSLRWRIAAWYVALLIVAILAVTLAVSARFQQILYEQAQSHLNATMQDIERSTVPPVPAFTLPASIDPLEVLSSSDNLERWASVTTYLQVEDVQGHVLAKSFNLGSAGFPPAPTLTPAKPSATRTVDMNGTPFLIESKLLRSGPFAVVVQIGEPLDLVTRAFREMRQAIIIILIIAVLAVIGLSIVLATQATNPMNQLARAMKEIGSDRLNRRVRWKGRNDEIGRLAETFDELMARLEESFARERQFISDASHELRTPLTSINANAQMLARWGDRDERIRRESLETIAKESSSLAAMVTGMLTLAKADSGEPIPQEAVSLNDVAAESVESAQQRARAKDLTLRFEASAVPVLVHGDAALLHQLFNNLIDNAIKFTDSGTVSVRVRSEGGEAIVEVQDTGPGIASVEIPFVFDRFYRSDRSRSRTIPGTGLGLAIVRSIARVHNGKVEAHTLSSGGALFVVRLPRMAASA